MAPALCSVVTTLQSLACKAILASVSMCASPGLSVSVFLFPSSIHPVTHPLLVLSLRLAIILSSLLPPWNLSTSGQPHLPGCPQDINRTQRLVSVYPRPLTHCRAARAAHTSVPSACILCAVISFDIPIEVGSAWEICFIRLPSPALSLSLSLALTHFLRDL